MRDVRYRVWDKTNKRMGAVQAMYFTCYSGFCEKVSSVVTHYTTQDNLIDGEHEELYENFELMQYTGLKDKNGVEIYEGDIVEFDSSIPPPSDTNYPIDGQRGLIVFTLGRFMIKMPTGTNYGFHYLDELGDWVVIGNIHENPELYEALK